MANLLCLSLYLFALEIQKKVTTFNSKSTHSQEVRFGEEEDKHFPHPGAGHVSWRAFLNTVNQVYS